MYNILKVITYSLFDQHITVMENVLKLEIISKNFGGVEALSDVDMSLQKG